jgi:hypothetical protein
VATAVVIAAAALMSAGDAYEEHLPNWNRFFEVPSRRRLARCSAERRPVGDPYCGEEP